MKDGIHQDLLAAQISVPWYASHVPSLTANRGGTQSTQRPHATGARLAHSYRRRISARVTIHPPAGFLGLYRGLSSLLYFSVPKVATRFFAFETLRNNLQVRVCECRNCAAHLCCTQCRLRPRSTQFSGTPNVASVLGRAGPRALRCAYRHPMTRCLAASCLRCVGSVNWARAAHQLCRAGCGTIDHRVAAMQSPCNMRATAK